MACENWKPLIAAEAFGGNSEADSRALSEHLKSCASCRALLAEIQALQTALPRQSLPVDEAFWSRQRSAILENLPPRNGPVPAHWHRWLTPALALGILVSAAGIHEHRQAVRRDLQIAQNLPILENMDMLQNLDILEDSTLWEKQ